MTTPSEIYRTAARWSPQQRHTLQQRLHREHARKQLVDAAAHPAELAQLCDRDYRITPAVELVSRAVETTLRRPGRNLLVTAPPQELKSRLCAVWTPIRALQLHPDWRIMVLTYADGLAEEHSSAARQMIVSHGSGVTDPITGAAVEDKLGISLRQDRHAVGRWSINEGAGGVVAAGLSATITGKPADLLIIDDPYKNMQEADSTAIRHRVDTWYRSVARTRLAPGANTILIQTRWHPSDLAGTILHEQRELPPDARTWRYINIPAIAADGVPDALGREPGEALESARGRTADEFRATERTVGRRVWNALYQGMPTPPEGGLFSRSWFADHRMAAAPDGGLRIVAVDPAETGEHDEAGVIAAALCPDGRVALTHDRSGHMTSDGWSKTAVDLAIRTGAKEIAVEAYTAGLTYINVVSREIAQREKAAVRAGNTKLAGYLQRLTVYRWRGSGDAVARSGLLRQAVETGKAAMVGFELAEMEDQACLWQVGQHQPDRVAAAVIAHDRLMQLSGQRSDIGSPVRSITKGGGSNRRRSDWLSRKVE